MRVYEVSFDLAHFQSLYLSDRKHNLQDVLTFNGRSRKNILTPPNVHVLYPMKIEPDFWMLEHSASLALSPQAAATLSFQLSAAGELLPLPYADRMLQVLNITQCVNAMRRDQCEFRYGPIPIKFAFYPGRICSSLFKIPETAVGQILCAEWDGDPEREFKAAVNHYQLKGLRFKQLWEG